MFAHTIKVRAFREGSSQPEILRFKNKTCSRSVKENFTSFGPDNGEREWRFCVAELKIC